jgi:hypothetical protein
MTDISFSDQSSAVDALGELTALFSALPQVEALALTGSRVSGLAPDAGSDFDLCLFISAPIPIAQREAWIDQLGGAMRADLGHNFWGECDEWFHAPSGAGFDIVYWDTAWVEDLLRRVITQHQPSLGYSTAHWFTIRHAQTLFDRHGWLARMQDWSRAPYPEELRTAILRDNRVVLRDMISSYRAQIAKALVRNDLVSINHRVAGLLASYFDCIFACSRVLHPGEKRLIEQAARLCSSLPAGMADDVQAVLRSSASAGPRLLDDIDRLVDRLESWLAANH